MKNSIRMGSATDLLSRQEKVEPENEKSRQASGSGKWSLRPLPAAFLSFAAVASFVAIGQASPGFAQLPAPDPAMFTNWLVSAAAALAIAALGKQFIRKTPLEAQFLTCKEFADFREKLDTDLAALGNKIDRCYDLLGHRLDNLSTRMDEVRSLVDRVDERTRERRTNIRK